MKKSEYENMLYENMQSERCLNLMRMIIVQGLIDANAKTKNKIRKKGKKVMQKFFKKDNKWFIRICELIDVDKNYILKIYKKIRRWRNRKSCLIDTLNSDNLTKIISEDFGNFKKN